MSQSTMSILMVDESLVDQWLMGEALAEEMPHARVMRISNRLEARGVLCSLESVDPPACMVLDYRTPAVLRKILLYAFVQNERWHGLPRIILHDQESDPTLDAWAQDKALRVQAKPVSFEEYLAFTATLCQECRQAMPMSMT
jgi:DNA-binding NtrC family response regulator